MFGFADGLSATNVCKGSGCYVGTRTLMEDLRGPWIRFDVVRPRIITPVYTTTRLLFNESLRWRSFNSAATISIMSTVTPSPAGETLLRTPRLNKGVLGDAV